MKRYRCGGIQNEDIEKWGKTFIRAYELQGIAAFAKYQYSIATSILNQKISVDLREKLIQYIKDIPNPKDVLLEALIEIMFDDFYNVNTRILAVNALRALFPKRMPNSKYMQCAVTRVMEDIINSPQTPELHNTVEDALQSINIAVQKDGPESALPVTN